MDQHIVTAWATEYAQLEARLADVIGERDSYRLIAFAALDRLRSTTTVLDRTRTQLRRLTEQVRAGRTDGVPVQYPVSPPQRSYTTKHGTQPRRYRSLYRRTPDPSLEARL